MGGFDIFHSTLNDSNKWSEPVNVGYPINTPNDDLFYIPTADFQLDYFEKVDSLIIDSVTYKDVFKLNSDYGSYYDKDSIYADSLYYNYEYGILKILMSNGESYEIVK